MSWQEDILPGPNVSQAVPIELTATGAAVAVEDGDQLVFRYTGESGDLPMAYVPNGEGANTGGRIPFIELPR